MTGEDGEKMRPLIGIPTSPFKHSYSEITPVNIDKEEFDYFWLLSVLTEKIVSCVRAAGGVPLLLCVELGLMQRFEAGGLFLNCHY